MKIRVESSRGQAIIVVVLTLLVMAILIPAMVYLTNAESRRAEKFKSDTATYNLAKAGVHKALRALTSSTGTWRGLIDLGTALPGFDGITVFNDLIGGGGSYTVSVTSNAYNEAVIVSIATDSNRRETRKIKASFKETLMDGVALRAGRGVYFSTSTRVEWGRVLSKGRIYASPLASPQFCSSTLVDFDTNGADPPNCDQPNCCQWSSYDETGSGIPLDVDLSFYRSSAQATSTYYGFSQKWSSVTYAGGGTMFVEGDLIIDSPGIGIVGNLIVTGNLTSTTGSFGMSTAPAMAFPTHAWRNYCNDWSRYKTQFDGTAPASFPGLSDTYQASVGSITIAVNNLWAVQGFTYVGGDFVINSTGTTYMQGAMYVQGAASSTASAFYLYGQDKAQNYIQVGTVPLSQNYWVDIP